MTNDERSKIEARVRSYLAPALADGPWLTHHVRMNWELYEKAKAANPALTLEMYFERQNAPTKSSKRRRGRS